MVGGTRPTKWRGARQKAAQRLVTIGAALLGAYDGLSTAKLDKSSISGGPELSLYNLSYPEWGSVSVSYEGEKGEHEWHMGVFESGSTVGTTYKASATNAEILAETKRLMKQMGW